MKIAIIGASKDRNKYGNKAVRAYKSKEHAVFPVNPHEKEIEGLPCYSTVLDIPMEVDIASFYLPPEIGIKVVEDLVKKGIKKAYLNPGSESEELVNRLRLYGMEVTLGCSILAIGVDPNSV